MTVDEKGLAERLLARHQALLALPHRALTRHEPSDVELLLDAALAILAYESAKSAEGAVAWRMAPVEPTREMIEAGDREMPVSAAPGGACVDVYSAMLAAAPPPPQVPHE